MATESMFDETKKFFDIFEPRGEILAGVKISGSIQVLGEINQVNKGKVISALTGRQAMILGQKRKEGDRAAIFYSLKYDEKLRVLLNEPQFKEDLGWANFMSATLFMLESSGKKVSGMNVFIDNEIPDHFNACSTEAIEIGTAKIAEKFGDFIVTDPALAEICADGEKQFLGKDKNAAKYLPLLGAKKGSFFFQDFKSGKSGNIPIENDKYVFCVMSSGIKKKQTEEKAAAIMSVVEEAMELIRKAGGSIEGLHSLNSEQFDGFRGSLSIQQRKRCAFFISENERVYSAATSLSKGDVESFIRIVNESQKNIKNRLELVDEENEILVDICQDIPEVKAVRMLNLGVDGSVFLVVEKPKFKQAETRIRKTFLARTGLELNTEPITLENEFEEITVNVAEFKK